MRFRLLLPSEREPHLSEGDFSLSRRFRGLAACAFALAGGFSFKEHRRLFRSPSQALASLATLHAFQCKRITPIPANTPISSGTHPLNNSKRAKMARPGWHARKMVLTRNRPAHTPRTPTHTRDAHTSARHARQRTHTHTHTHASACTRTHAHAHRPAHTHTHTLAPAHTQGPPRPRTRETPNGRHFARGSKCDANAPSVGASGMQGVASLDLTRGHTREAEE